jgi:HECT-domain (ubiquitin-transferase)
VLWVQSTVADCRSPLTISQLKKLTHVNVASLGIEEKKQWLEIQCDELRISYLRESLTLVIDRPNILSDSFSQYITTDGFDFHKEIKIFFVGEVAQDAGGLMREWITELTKSLFNEETGLFRACRGENDISYFLNPNAKFQFPDYEHLGYFRFAGAVLAKALFDKIPILGRLNRVLYRNLTTKNRYESLITVEDLKDFDF